MLYFFIGYKSKLFIVIFFKNNMISEDLKARYTMHMNEENSNSNNVSGKAIPLKQ